MPSHSLKHSRRNSLLVAALLVGLAACGSEAGSAPDKGAQESTSTGSTAGAPATPPKTSQPTAAGQAQTAASKPSSSPGSSAATPSTPGAQMPAQNMPSMNAAPTDPMAMPTVPTVPTVPTMPTKDPADPAMPADPGTVNLPVDMGTPTLYWLEIVSGVVVKGSPDGGDQKNVVTGGALSAPDGVTIDPEGKHFFVLNMGTVIGGGNQGSLVRYNLDGSGGEVIMKPGSMADGETFNTGKQVTIDRVNKKLYMGDREGSKVWRCDYDGGNLEVLVSGHGVQQIVGVGADPTKKHFYFSDRNGKKLFRAGMDMPAGESHADRKDVELIYVEKVNNSMPLDIELDLEERMIYWTDRTQGKIQGMHMDIPAGETPENRTDVKTIKDGLTEAIGLAFDHQEKTLFVTHNGTVSKVKTDATGFERIGTSGRTGIAFARIAP